jgi:hypothetical protein
VGDGIGEKDLCPSSKVGLDMGDSVMVSPARNTLLETLEGESSLDCSVEVDGVRERG